MLFLALLSLAWAQSESPAAQTDIPGTCAVYTGELCADVIPPGSIVWIFVNETQASIEAPGGVLATYNTLLAGVLTRDQNCGQLAKKQVCGAAFPPCDTDFGAPLPSLVCRSLCLETNAACLALFSQFGAQVTDCNGELETWTHRYPRWADQSTTFASGTVPCNDGTAYRGAVATCNEPLIEKDGGCVPMCPFNMYKTVSSHWTGLKAFSNFVAYISWFSSLFMVVTWMAFPHKRKFPSVMILYVAVNSFFIATAIVMRTWNLPIEHKCTDPATPAGPSNGACFFQFWFIHYNSLSLSFWWLLIGVNLFLQLVLEIKGAARFQVYYHVFAWGLPFLLTIIPLGLDLVHYHFFFDLCWINPHPGIHLTRYYFVWIGLVMGIVTLCMFAVVWKIFKVTHKSSHGASEEKLIKRMFAQMRTIAFVVLFVLVYSFIFAFKYNADAKYADLETAIFNYSVCEGATPGECKLETPISIALAGGQDVLVSLQGFIVFLLIGLTKDTLDCYRGKFDFLLGFFAASARTSNTGVTSMDSGIKSGTSEMRSVKSEDRSRY